MQVFKFKPVLVWLFALIGMFLLTSGCAGGSRGTGIRTIVGAHNRLDESQDFAPIIDLFRDAKLATCALSKIPRGALVIISQAGIATFRQNSSGHCLVQLRGREDRVLLESRAVPKDLQFMLRTVDAAGVVVKQRIAESQGLSLAANEIPENGHADIFILPKNGEFEEIGRIEIIDPNL